MRPKCFVPDFKIALHKEFSCFFHEFKTDCPINIEISPCGLCNAKCEFCFYKDSKDKDILDLDLLIKNIDCFEKMGVRAITWTGGGEPTLHPDFAEFSYYTYEKTCMDQGLFTNGIDISIANRIDYDVFDWVRISKTNFDWNIDVIEKINNDCDKVGLCLNWSNIDNDYVDLHKALEIADKLDLDYVQVRPALKSHGEKTDILPPKEFDHKKLFITDYKFLDAQADRGYNICMGYHFVPFVWQNGDVTACGYQRDGRYLFGNLYKDQFDIIWKKKPMSLPVLNDCQVCCKNDQINKTISKCMDIVDINFV